VVHRLHIEDILLHPRGLELVFLLVVQEVVDGVLQLAAVVTALRGDGLTEGVSYNIVVRRLMSWPHVTADHLGPVEDLHDVPELQPSSM
jgi:hypothetical protein